MTIMTWRFIFLVEFEEKSWLTNILFFGTNSMCHSSTITLGAIPSWLGPLLLINGYSHSFSTPAFSVPFAFVLYHLVLWSERLSNTLSTPTTCDHYMCTFYIHFSMLSNFNIMHYHKYSVILEKILHSVSIISSVLS